ncbi:hypothetical protein [Nostoc sp.]
MSFPSTAVYCLLFPDNSNGIRYLDRWTVEQIMAAVVAAND